MRSPFILAAASFRNSGYSSSTNLSAAALSPLRKSAISRAIVSGSEDLSYMQCGLILAIEEKNLLIVAECVLLLSLVSMTANFAGDPVWTVDPVGYSRPRAKETKQ